MLEQRRYKRSWTMPRTEFLHWLGRKSHKFRILSDNMYVTRPISVGWQADLPKDLEHFMVSFLALRSNQELILWLLVDNEENVLDFCSILMSIEELELCILTPPGVPQSMLLLMDMEQFGPSTIIGTDIGQAGPSWRSWPLDFWK